MFVDIAIRRDLISFRKDWARWSAGERLTAKSPRFSHSPPP